MLLLLSIATFEGTDYGSMLTAVVPESPPAVLWAVSACSSSSIGVFRSSKTAADPCCNKGLSHTLPNSPPFPACHAWLGSLCLFCSAQSEKINQLPLLLLLSLQCVLLGIRS